MKTREQQYRENINKIFNEIEQPSDISVAI